jgi:hypothetical protein
MVAGSPGEVEELVRLLLILPGTVRQAHLEPILIMDGLGNVYDCRLRAAVAIELQ